MKPGPWKKFNISEWIRNRGHVGDITHGKGEDVKLFYKTLSHGQNLL